MREKIFKALKNTGLEVVYRTWSEGSEFKMPYIAYRLIDTDNFGADNKMFCPVNNWAVELYSEKKDDESEQAVEDAINSLEVSFNKYESQIDKDTTLVLYQFSTIG